MIDRRVSCASALLCIAACSFPASFPDYQLADLSPTCHNGVRDGDEAGVDCGASCNACPLCGDGLRDGDETGVDCGGSCAACPTCDDELQNGSESAIDCGGTCPERCETNERCREAADCASLVCDGVCQPPDCNDGVRNGQETGKDCGGGCPGCVNGSACLVGGDCTSARCQSQVCVSAGCIDGIRNGLETDTDCGGTECAPCQAPNQCKIDSDCDSLICTSGKTCAAATCSDSTQNQGESAVDCGGPACPRCQNGLTCGATSDCESALCQNGTCVYENPLGQPLNRARWVFTTSETSTQQGAHDALDGSPMTAWSSGSTQHDGMYVQLDLGKPEIFFKALLVVTEPPHDQDFPRTMDVYVSNDGNFGDPSASVDGNQWTWIDFQSAQVGRYVRFVLTQPRTTWWSIGELTLYN
jgi:hypothetical protein